MSSFAVTVGVLVIVVTQIPTSPIAKITDIKAFENEIAYEVEITDADNALDLSTLRVVLENQFDTFSYPIDLGVTTGAFYNLEPNTTYHLQVFGSKGFGDEKLASRYIKTEPLDGGAIVNYTLLESFDQFLNYEIRVLINDPDNIYTDINLMYGYEFPFEPLNDLQNIPITQNDQIIELYDVPNYHTMVYLYLVATTNLSEEVILDELSFSVPLTIESFVYLDQIDQTLIKYNLYIDSYLPSNALYEVYVHQNGRLVKKETIKTNLDDSNYEQIYPVILRDLKKNTIYDVSFKVTYQDPQTLRTESKIFHEDQVKTLSDYSIDLEITYLDYGIEVFINLNDPNHYFQVPYFEIYELEEFYEFQYSTETFSFTPDGDVKYVSFTILYPPITDYHLIIGVRNQDNSSIKHIILDEIVHP